MATDTARERPLRYFCPRCRWEMPPDAPEALPGWAFCSVCGTALTTETLATLASAPPQALRRRAVLQYAGFWRRFAGWLIDYLLVLVAVFVVAVAVEFVIVASGSDLSEQQQILGVYLFAIPVSIVYHIVFSATGGTLGKRAVGLRLVDEDGGLPGWRRASIRYVISIFSGLVFSWGYWRMIFEAQKQTMHDQAAGTYVVPVNSLD